MDHANAVQAKMGEKYILGELTAFEEDEFAEHFFDCEECSNDVRMTSLFLATAKKVLAEDRARAVSGQVKPRISIWQSARYSIAASVALFAFTLYQNTITIPSLRQAAAPQALDFFSLANLGSRSSTQTVITPTGGRPFILLLDIPPQPDASEYRAEVLTPEGRVLFAINISTVMAAKTVPLLIPGSTLAKGDYLLALSSRPKDGGSFLEFERQPLAVR